MKIAAYSDLWISDDRKTSSSRRTQKYSKEFKLKRKGVDTWSVFVILLPVRSNKYSN